MKAVFVAAVGLALLSAGCVRQERFRFVPSITACFDDSANASPVNAPPDQKPSLDCRHSLYKMAFVEFDSQGKAFDTAQEAAALKLIEREKAGVKGSKIITVVYVHGWQNNASEASPGNKPKDVEKFQGAMLELGYRAEKAAREANTERVPVVGVYFGWRGKTLMGPRWFNFVSLWGRRNTANRVGSGTDLAVILNRIIEATNGSDGRSRVLMIGHSFGARVLEHAIETKKVMLYDAARGGDMVTPRVDLVLYVNSANDARLSMARVQQLQASKVEVRHPDFDPAECVEGAAPSTTLDAETREARCREYPLLVAITSKSDLATKRLLPIANTMNGDDLPREVSENLPPLPTTDTFADPLPSPDTYKKVAAGHFAFLQSHVVREISCPASLRSNVRRGEAKTVEQRIDEAVQKAVARALGKGPSDEEERALARKNETEEKLRIEKALHPVCPVGDKTCRFVFRTLGEQPTCFQADRRDGVDGKQPFNRTPFWIMDVDASVIKDHGDIWNVSFVEMLGQLMAPRGFFEPGAGRIQLRAVAESPQ
jgi:hypothetical protein